MFLNIFISNMLQIWDSVNMGTDSLSASMRGSMTYFTSANSGETYMGGHTYTAMATC